MQHLGAETELVEVMRDLMATMSPEERLQGLTAEERLQGLTAEERLQGLGERRSARREGASNACDLEVEDAVDQPPDR